MIIDEENNNIFIIEKLNSLKNELNRDQVNLKSVQRDIKQLENYDNTSNYEYLNSLLEPEKQKGGKIPFNVPVPTCSFQLHNYITFQTNEAGSDVFTVNPWFLASESALNKSFPSWSQGETWTMTKTCGMYFFSNEANLGSQPTTGAWSFPQDFSQVIPDVYDKYRLVSASLVVRYIGQLDECSGVIGGGISYAKSNYLGARIYSSLDPNNYGSRTTIFNDYGDFELIRDCYYHTENSCLEGLRMLYFPLDNSFNEFKKVLDKPDVTPVNVGGARGLIVSDKYFRNGFNWFIYLQGCPNAGTRNFRADYYLNFECIPKAEFMNYMPISLNIKPCLTNELRKKFIEEVQEKAIQKLNIY